MKNLSFEAGSILVDDLRDELADLKLPEKPHFVVRLSHKGPAALTTLSLDLDLLLTKPVSYGRRELFLSSGI